MIYPDDVDDPGGLVRIVDTALPALLRRERHHYVYARIQRNKTKKDNRI
jgi:hypothetical protein